MRLAGRFAPWIAVLLLLSLALPLAAQDTPFITVTQDDNLGPFLADANGMSLYLFDHDTLDVTNCYDRCATAWPPLLVDSADQITADPSIPGEFGTTERTDGTLQVTYNGWPLYYWQHDEGPGDVTGHRVGRVWWVVAPATAYASLDADLGGSILVGPTGMTLYTFTEDEPGVSNCSGDCATNWPPLTVESAEAFIPGVNLVGEFGTIEREDGTLQVTYNGWPLYYYAEDTARGDTNGQGRGDKWFVVRPESVSWTEDATVGNYLTSFDGMTLYTFANDTEGVSNCADECAENWPPFTVSSADTLVAPEGLPGELGTIERADGALQVTYNGWPLYFYAEDHAPGETTGNGAGDVWSVALADSGM